MKTFNVGVLKAGFTGVSPVVLMMQMLKFKVLGFDADRVFVAVRALTSTGAEQKVMQDAKAQFGVEVKAFSYGEQPQSPIVKSESSCKDALAVLEKLGKQ